MTLSATVLMDPEDGVHGPVCPVHVIIVDSQVERVESVLDRAEINNNFSVAAGKVAPLDFVEKGITPVQIFFRNRKKNIVKICILPNVTIGSMQRRRFVPRSGEDAWVWKAPMTFLQLGIFQMFVRNLFDKAICKYL